MSGQRSTGLLATLVLFSFLVGIFIGANSSFPRREIRAITGMIGNGQVESSRKTASDGFSLHYQRRVDHFTAHGQQADIAMVGDSITDQVEWKELLPEYNVVNRGISGDTTDGVLNRLDSIVGTGAEIAFIMIGVNDFRNGARVDDVFGNYTHIIEELEAAGVAPIVLSTLLVGPKWAPLNVSIRELNARLSGYVVKRGVAFIDLNAVLADGENLRPEFTNDDIHLTADAYGIWRNVIVDWLNAPGRHAAIVTR